MLLTHLKLKVKEWKICTIKILTKADAIAILRSDSAEFKEILIGIKRNTWVAGSHNSSLLSLAPAHRNTCFRITCFHSLQFQIPCSV